jgi:aspartyl/glutamyl-tRNA(Asn/Gln) amidotransferase C subunit
MKEEISIEVFDHLVSLAALELNAEQAQYLRQQLNRQLEVIHELESIPLDEEISISSHGVAYKSAIIPALRADEWQPYSNVEELLSQVPELRDRFVVVPDIPHQKLDAS